MFCRLTPQRLGLIVMSSPRPAVQNLRTVSGIVLPPQVSPERHVRFVGGVPFCPGSPRPLVRLLQQPIERPHRCQELMERGAAHEEHMVPSSTMDSAAVAGALACRSTRSRQAAVGVGLRTTCHCPGTFVRDGPPAMMISSTAVSNLNGPSRSESRATSHSWP